MGTDVHIVLGSINLEAVARRKAISAPSEGKSLALFDNLQVDVEDFVLEEVPEEYDLHRNYTLFGWLAGIRGDIKPFCELDSRKEKTLEFIDWYDNQYRSKLKAAKKTEVFGYQSHGYDEIEDRYDIGDHSRIIHTVNSLNAFDYDQVIEVENTESPDYTWENMVYMRDPEGITYRERFGEQYFKLLDYCVRENWHFLLLGFDN